MSPKTATYIGVALGSVIGGNIPLLWGASTFSFSSIALGGLGALVGLWVAFKVTH